MSPPAHPRPCFPALSLLQVGHGIPSPLWSYTNPFFKTGNFFPVFPDNSCQSPPLLFTYYGKAIESGSKSPNKNTHSCCCSILNYFLIFCTPLYIPNPKEKKKVYSKFPSPFKLVMGSATDAFTTRDINFFIRSKVLGVNSVYCMRCQGNYRWSALFLRTAGASGGGSPPCLQMHHRRIAALSFSQAS